MTALLPELEMEFPPKPGYVRTARHTVAALAHMLGMPESSVEDIRLAVSEACTNAVSANARADRGGEPVRVRVELDERRLLVEVLDRGPALDEALRGKPPEYDSQEFTFEKGLSLPLIEGLVESLEILPREGGGTRLRMSLSAGELPAPNG